MSLPINGTRIVTTVFAAALRAVQIKGVDELTLKDCVPFSSNVPEFLQCGGRAIASTPLLGGRRRGSIYHPRRGCEKWRGAALPAAGQEGNRPTEKQALHRAGFYRWERKEV